MHHVIHKTSGDSFDTERYNHAQIQRGGAGGPDPPGKS